MGRREDGYHRLSMLNTTIALFDEISIERRGQGVVFQSEGSSIGNLGSDEDNLIFRAAKLFLEKYDTGNCGVSICLKKNIPIGAGLGGGSSDAAATLIAMSQIFEKEIQGRANTTELKKIGAGLGSDIPYFIEGGLCIVTGVGDCIEKLPTSPLSNKPFLLVTPNEHSSTIAVYKDFAATIPTKDLLPDPLLPIEPERVNFMPTYESILNLISNDLSISVFRRTPICKDLLTIMRKFDDCVCGLTGSGSALFCIPKQEFDVSALNNVKSALPETVTSNILDFY